MYTFPLVGIGQPSHTRHHAQHVVVRGIHANRGRQVQADRVVGHREQERGVINAGQVAGARGLVLLRLQGKRVDVDADRRDVGVVLVRLHPVEVLALADRETVVAVELQERSDDGVLARHALHASDGVARLQAGPVPPVGVVEGLLALERTDDGVIARDEGVTLDNPHKLLAGVVEVQLDLVGGGGDGLTARELQHVDQVLVGDLGELAALIRVQVDVVDVQGRSNQALGGNAVADGVGVTDARGRVPAEVVQGVEL